MLDIVGYYCYGFGSCSMEFCRYPPLLFPSSIGSFLGFHLFFIEILNSYLKILQHVHTFFLTFSFWLFCLSLLPLETCILEHFFPFLYQ